jgi:hypothetical protein
MMPQRAPDTAEQIQRFPVLREVTVVPTPRKNPKRATTGDSTQAATNRKTANLKPSYESVNILNGKTLRTGISIAIKSSQAVGHAWRRASE